MFYSALQDSEYIATGLNSTDRNECIEDVFEYAMTDSEEETEGMSIAAKESHLNTLGFYIIDHAKPMPELDDIDEDDNN